MSIVISVTSGSGPGGIIPTARVHARRSGAIVDMRSGSVTTAIENAKVKAVEFAMREVSLHGGASIETIVDGESIGIELFGNYVETDLTGKEEERLEDEDAIVAAKEAFPDIVELAKSIEPEPEPEPEPELEPEPEPEPEPEVIAGHEDVIEPAAEIDIPEITVEVTQNGDRIDVIVNSPNDFTLWRMVGNRHGTRDIDVGTTELSYKGLVEETTFRIDGEDGVILFMG